MTTDRPITTIPNEVDAYAGNARWRFYGVLFNAGTGLGPDERKRLVDALVVAHDIEVGRALKNQREGIAEAQAKVPNPYWANEPMQRAYSQAQSEIAQIARDYGASRP